MRSVVFTVFLLTAGLLAFFVTQGPGGLVATGTTRLAEGWDTHRYCFVQPTLERTTRDATGKQTTTSVQVTLIAHGVGIRAPWLEVTPTEGGVELRSLDGRSFRLPPTARTAWLHGDGTWRHDSRAIPDLTGLGGSLRDDPEARLLPELARRAPAMAALVDRIASELGEAPR